MGDSSQKNFYDVIRALESGRIYKRPKVQSDALVEEDNRVQPLLMALPATVATHEAVKTGLKAEVVETLVARDEAPLPLEGTPSGSPTLTQKQWLAA